MQYYLSNDIFPHSADFAVAFIGGLTIGLILLAAPVVSLSSAKLGTRATLGIGTVLETAALVAASFSYRFWHLYLTQGVLYGCGAGLLWLGASPIIPQWFTKRRGFANSLALAGSGAGGLVYSLVVEKILAELGLAWSFRITACSTFTGNAICTALIRDRNKTIKPVHSPFNANLCRNTRFLSIQAWMLLSVMGYTIIMFSVPPYARRVGLSSQQASVAGAVVNAGMMFGRPFVGYYSDTLGRTNIVTAGTALCGLFCIAIWIPVTNYAGILAFSFLAGCLCGTCWVVGTHSHAVDFAWLILQCLPPLLADSLGLRVLPSALSLTWLVLVIPGAGRFIAVVLLPCAN